MTPDLVIFNPCDCSGELTSYTIAYFDDESGDWWLGRADWVILRHVLAVWKHVFGY